MSVNLLYFFLSLSFISFIFITTDLSCSLAALFFGSILSTSEKSLFADSNSDNPKFACVEITHSVVSSVGYQLQHVNQQVTNDYSS